jgi:hypothetical protein
MSSLQLFEDSETYLRLLGDEGFPFRHLDDCRVAEQDLLDGVLDLFLRVVETAELGQPDSVSEFWETFSADPMECRQSKPIYKVLVSSHEKL